MLAAVGIGKAKHHAAAILSHVIAPLQYLCAALLQRQRSTLMCAAPTVPSRVLSIDIFAWF